MPLTSERRAHSYTPSTYDMFGLDESSSGPNSVITTGQPAAIAASPRPWQPHAAHEGGPFLNSYGCHDNARLSSGSVGGLATTKSRSKDQSSVPIRISPFHPAARTTSTPCW